MDSVTNLNLKKQTVMLLSFRLYLLFLLYLRQLLFKKMQKKNINMMLKVKLSIFVKDQNEVDHLSFHRFITFIKKKKCLYVLIACFKFCIYKKRLYFALQSFINLFKPFSSNRITNK